MDLVSASYADADDVHNIHESASESVRHLLVLVPLRHATSDRLADRAADGRALIEPDVVDAFVRADGADLLGADERAYNERAHGRADDCADFIGAHGPADGGPYAWADRRADGVLVFVRLRDADPVAGPDD